MRKALLLLSVSLIVHCTTFAQTPSASFKGVELGKTIDEVPNLDRFSCDPPRPVPSGLDRTLSGAERKALLELFAGICVLKPGIRESIAQVDVFEHSFSVLPDKTVSSIEVVFDRRGFEHVLSAMRERFGTETRVTPREGDSVPLHDWEVQGNTVRLMRVGASRFGAHVLMFLGSAQSGKGDSRSRARDF